MSTSRSDRDESKVEEQASESIAAESPASEVVSAREAASEKIAAINGDPVPVNTDVSVAPDATVNPEAVWGRDADGNVAAYVDERAAIEAGAHVVERIRGELSPMLSSAPAYLTKKPE